jgi:acetyl esterase/lipase
MRKISIPGTLLAVLLATAAFCQAQLPEALKAAVLVAHGYALDANITYKVANNYEAKLDVYHRKDAKAPLPVVIDIHGGGWVRGVKEWSQLEIMPYLQMGFEVVNVEYRLGSVSPAPAAVEDCLAALRWVGRNAKKYNFDTSKIVVTGLSAGGHLALTTGMIPESAGFDADCSFEDGRSWSSTCTDPRPKVAAIINWFGITDVKDLAGGPNARSYAVQWFGSLPNREALATKVSPLTYVRPGLPPILTIHGDSDQVVPYAHAVRLHEALDKAGVRNQLLTIPGGGHNDFTADQFLLCFETIRKFLLQTGILSPGESTK